VKYIFYLPGSTNLYFISLSFVETYLVKSTELPFSTLLPYSIEQLSYRTSYSTIQNLRTTSPTVYSVTVFNWRAYLLIFIIISQPECKSTAQSRYSSRTARGSANCIDIYLLMVCTCDNPFAPHCHSLVSVRFVLAIETARPGSVATMHNISFYYTMCYSLFCGILHNITL
jgi:hypothetical protein